MRTVLWDKHGEPVLYLTGSGVLYALTNDPLGMLTTPSAGGWRAALDFQSRPKGWYKDGLLYDLEGRLLAFTKGAQAPLELPRAQPLRTPLKPRPAPGLALEGPLPPLPTFRAEWSPHPLPSLFASRE